MRQGAPQLPTSVSTALTSLSISATSCAVRCGKRCATRLGTASIPARTVLKTPDHAASTSAASTSDPRSFAAFVSAMSACAAASNVRARQSLSLAVRLWRF